MRVRRALSPAMRGIFHKEGTMSHAPLNLAVLISGGGTSLQNLIDRIESGTLNARIRLVLSSRRDAKGLGRADRHSIPREVCESRLYPNFEEFSIDVWERIETQPVDLVCMAGFMCFLRIKESFAGRVMNIHPALIPAFCGKGLYGRRVHEAVAESGVKVSGCTVHFADNEYDHGPIIIQRTAPVFAEDTPDTIAARVFEQECQAYPEAIRLFAENKLRIEGRKTHILE